MVHDLTTTASVKGHCLLYNEQNLLRFMVTIFVVFYELPHEVKKIHIMTQVVLTLITLLCEPRSLQKQLPAVIMVNCPTKRKQNV